MLSLMNDGMLHMLKFLSFFACFLYFSAPSSLTAVWAAVLFHFFPLVASPEVLSALLLAPLRYFHPIRTLESCLGLMSNASHASLAVPLLKYSHHIFNQTAVAKMWVGPFVGDLTIPGASSLGSTVLSIFCSVVSAAVCTLGSFIGFNYRAGTFTCTSGHIATYRTVSKVSLLPILPSDEMFTHAILMLAHASLR